MLWTVNTDYHKIKKP